MISEKQKHRLINYVMTLTIILLTVLRKPQLLYIPRLYAEEGQIFLSFAYNNSLIHYLLSPMFGYYALYNVIATSFATLFPLEIAPLVTTYQALIVQITTSAYVIWSDIPILDTNIKRCLVALSFPLLCPSQVWLTTIGIQYWLCIMTALILLEGPSLINYSYILKALLLLISGLTGVLSCLLTPLYMLKLFATKSKRFILYASILSMCSVIQLTIFVTAYLKHDNGLAYRLVRDKPIIDFIYKTTILFFHNMFVPRDLMVKITQTNSINNLDLAINEKIVSMLGKPLFAQYELLYIINSIVIVIVIIPIIKKYWRDIDYLNLLLASLIIHYFSVFLSINFTSGTRYLFAPMAILILVIIASNNKNKFSEIYRIYSSIIIALIILSHFVDYTPSMNQTYNDDWPVWKEEVRNWRLDKNSPLKIWPPPWQMNLK